MAAEIVNLRQARKRQARTSKEEQAAENRLRFGRSSSSREDPSSTDTVCGEIFAFPYPVNSGMKLSM